MANVIFKRGLQSALPSTRSDGVFYLTTDTGRLYVDVNTGTAQSPDVKRHLLNQTVQFVDTISELENKANAWTDAQKDAHINDIFYVTGSNILAVFTKTGENAGWKQINPDHDTRVTSASFTKTASSNTSVITLNITDNYHGGATTINAPFTIETAGGLTLSNNPNTGALVFTAPTYSLDKEVELGNEHTAIIKLDSSDNSLDSQIKLIGDNNISFETTATGLKVAVKDSHLTSNSVSFTQPGDGQLTVGVADSSGGGNEVTLSNLGIVLNDGAYVALKNTANKTIGSIYSAAEIDAKFRGLNGMRYVDIIASASDLPSTNVHVGDVYVIATNGLQIDPDFSGVQFNQHTLDRGEFPGGTARIGDLLIASGNETVVSGDSVITSGLEWTYIPSGNDSLDVSTYVAEASDVNNSLDLKNGTGATVAKIGLNAGTNITLSSTSASNGRILNTTISHATINSTTSTAETPSSGTSSFTAIKSLTLNNGHVTNIETDTFTPVTYDLVNAIASNTGTNSVDVTIGLQDSRGTDRNSSKFNLASSSIALSGDIYGNITMDLQWGTF